MKAYAIVIDKNEISENGFRVLKESSENVGNDFSISKFHAIVPDQVDSILESFNLNWNWTWKKVIIHEKSGLRQHPYPVKNRKKKIACALSHYLLWNKCHMENEDFLIFEHDSIFLRKLNIEELHNSNYDIIGINDPHGTTRLPRKFHSIVQSSKKNILNVPKIDNDKVPQGLAGNSAYYIKPEGAKNLLDAVKENGLWHNDAIMNMQLIPNMGVTKTYYTKVQGLKSTTSE